jgi:hypothetical protein
MANAGGVHINNHDTDHEAIIIEGVEILIRIIDNFLKIFGGEFRRFM